MTFTILVIETQEAHSGDTLLIDCVRRVHVYCQYQQQVKIGLCVNGYLFAAWHRTVVNTCYTNCIYHAPHTCQLS